MVSAEFKEEYMTLQGIQTYCSQLTSQNTKTVKSHLSLTLMRVKLVSLFFAKIKKVSTPTLLSTGRLLVETEDRMVTVAESSVSLLDLYRDVTSEATPEEETKVSLRTRRAQGVSICVCSV